MEKPGEGNDHDSPGTVKMFTAWPPSRPAQVGEHGTMMLQSRVVAVTGGFGQLGLAVVRAALDAGAQVAALDRARQPADARALAGALVLGDIDLAESSAATKALDQVVAQFGGLDALINIAGTFRWETLEKGS